MVIYGSYQSSKEIDNSEELLMNVLSIDFDWIMEPSIEAYNHISNTDRFGPLRTWEKIKAIIPGFDP